MDGDRPSLPLRRSCFYSCSHHATCLVNTIKHSWTMSGTTIHFPLSFSFSLTLDFACQISIIIATTLRSSSKPTTFCRSWLLVPFVISFFSRCLNHPCTIFGPRPQNDRNMGSTVSCCRLHFSFLISHYHLLFSGLHTPIRHIHPVQWASSQRFTYTNPPRHLRVRSGFRRFFSSPFRREYKKRGSCPPSFGSATPSVSFLHLDYYLFSLIIQSESFFRP
jgi:hypothetical protein